MDAFHLAAQIDTSSAFVIHGMQKKIE